MKPKRYTKIIVRWKCGIDGHSHMTEEIAARCIAKTEGKKPLRRWTPDEIADVLAMRSNGETFVSIGSKYNIGAQRARQVFETQLFRQRRQDMGLE